VTIIITKEEILMALDQVKEPDDIMFNLLNSHNIPINSKGYYYITWLIKKASRQETYVLKYKDYELCAAAFNSTATSVERALRYAFGQSDLENKRSLVALYFLTREYVSQKEGMDNESN